MRPPSPSVLSLGLVHSYVCGSVVNQIPFCVHQATSQVTAEAMHNLSPHNPTEHFSSARTWVLQCANSLASFAFGFVSLFPVHQFSPFQQPSEYPGILGTAVKWGHLDLSYTVVLRNIGTHMWKSFTNRFLETAVYYAHIKSTGSYKIIHIYICDKFTHMFISCSLDIQWEWVFFFSLQFTLGIF